MSDLPAALTDRTAFLLQLAVARVQALGEEALVELGVGGREYGALAVLAHLAPCTQIAVGRALGIDRTTTVAVLGGLEERGLVDRSLDPTNRRAYLVSLTAAGDQARARAAEVLVACEDRFLAPLDDSERAQLHGTLVRLIRA